MIFAGVVAFLFGLLLLLPGEIFFKRSDKLNLSIPFPEQKMKAIRIPLGILLLIVGIWNLVIAFYYPQIKFLHFSGLTTLIFGLLYLFVPDWLIPLASFSDQIIFSTDELLIKVKKTTGIILLLASFYIAYSLYLLVG